MSAFLNVTTKILAYGDPEISSNPRLKHADWLRNITGTAVSNPQSHAHSIPPGGSETIFDCTLPSTVDNTTALDLALSTLDASRYRLSHSAGTAPGFRTGRNLALNGVAVTFTVNSNATATVSLGSGSGFSAVQIGDEIFVPHTTTGDAANVISVLNAGFWRVLGKTSSTNITLARPFGQDFEGVTQTVTLTSNNQMRAFSSDGLQADDSIDITAGFSISTRKTFKVLTVTDQFVEFVSTTPLPSESGVLPTASGLQFFSHSKCFLYIESDQECAVRVNGDLSNTHRLSPSDASDANSVAQYMRRGPTWSLTIVNLSPVTLTATVIDCE